VSLNFKWLDVVVDAMVADSDLKRVDCERMIFAFIDELAESVNAGQYGDTFDLPGLGHFVKVEARPRAGFLYHPPNPFPVDFAVGARTAIKFIPSRELTDALN
jgi:nucleoid DNA-binding protein